jgi:hypothetical protein
MNEYEATIEQYINELPVGLQNQIKNGTWKLALSEISKKYSLTEEQKINLEREVLFVMIGIEDENDLDQNLVEELFISKLLSGELVEEIGNKIFKPISTKLSEISTKDPVADKTINESVLSESENTRYQTVSNRVNHIPDNLPTAEPLPKEDEMVENRFSILDQQKDVGMQIQTPVSKPIVNFFDQKLQTPTVSIKDSLEPQRPVKQYTADPYREPVE